MNLAHRELGGAGHEPLVILHGLLGSSRNWHAAGRDLAERFHVFALDLRNHGNSPHHPEMRHAAMARDVIEWIDARGLAPVALLGHSLGGHLAMKIACDRPDAVRLLFVVDVAPRRYPSEATPVLALRRLDLVAIRSRRDADAALAPAIPDGPTRRFLLTNLVLADGAAHWRVDLEAISANLDAIRDTSLRPGDRFDGPTCFLVGERSDFFGAGDVPAVRRHFPEARIVTIPACGHLPHFEKRREFVDAVFRFAREHG